MSETIENRETLLAIGSLSGELKQIVSSVAINQAQILRWQHDKEKRDEARQIRIEELIDRSLRQFKDETEESFAALHGMHKQLQIEVDHLEAEHNKMLGRTESQARTQKLISFAMGVCTFLLGVWQWLTHGVVPEAHH